MKEFMLFIRTEGDHLATLSAKEQQTHVQQVMVYMQDLMKTGKLKSAQPLEMEGVLVSGTKGKLKDGPFNETKEVIAGYFLIQAIFDVVPCSTTNVEAILLSAVFTLKSALESGLIWYAPCPLTEVRQ